MSWLEARGSQLEAKATKMAAKDGVGVWQGEFILPFILGGLLLLSPPLAAQITIGDNLNLTIVGDH